MVNFFNYKTLIFDFDGVLINSNKIKSKCFYDVSCKYGKLNADKLVKYHQNNGGISRQHKFDYFFSKILSRNNYSEDYNKILKDYSDCVTNNILVAEKFEDYKIVFQKSKHNNLQIVSGSDQIELRGIAKKLGISNYFDHKIYGSPMNKDQIFKMNINNNKIIFPAIYFGDSKYDYISAKNNNIDFVFISSWTEFEDWKTYCQINKILNYNSLKEFFSSIK